MSNATLPSPRERGCFFPRLKESPPCFAFPARAGVFLAGSGEGRVFRGLPRASGGVSIAGELRAQGIGPSPRERGCFR